MFLSAIQSIRVFPVGSGFPLQFFCSYTHKNISATIPNTHADFATNHSKATSFEYNGSIPDKDYTM
ncbi:MAG: hypothetical protein LBV64_05920 [Mediterranea sp.]|nr:hypothetical protein [Mediterranea sp.]